MKKLFPEAPDVPQPVANRAVRIVEKYFRLHRVERARDLPEEAKIRLLRDLRSFFDAELRHIGPAVGDATKRKGWLAKLIKRVENVLSFGEAGS